MEHWFKWAEWGQCPFIPEVITCYNLLTMYKQVEWAASTWRTWLWVMSQKPSAHNTRIDGIYGCSSPKNIPNAVKNPVKRELKVKQEHVFEFLKGSKCSAKLLWLILYIHGWDQPQQCSKCQSFHCLPLSSICWLKIVELHFIIIITISQHMCIV